MATRSITRTDVQNGSVLVWTGLLNGDDGTPLEVYDHADMSVAFTGTFGTGGTIKFEGSNDGTNYFEITDPQGNAISKTAASLEQGTEIVRYYRPRVSAGDGTTSLTCTLYMRRSRS